MDFFPKYDQIRSFMKKYLMENFNFYTVLVYFISQKQYLLNQLASQKKE